MSKEYEKPNYAKIVGITLGIMAGIGAAGVGAYLYCKKKGIKICICKSGECEDEEWYDDEDILDEIEGAEDDPAVEVEKEADPS